MTFNNNRKTIKVIETTRSRILKLIANSTNQLKSQLSTRYFISLRSATNSSDSAGPWHIQRVWQNSEQQLDIGGKIIS